MGTAGLLNSVTTTWWRYDGWVPIAEYADSETDWAVEGKSKTIPGMAEVPGIDPITAFALRLGV